MDKEKKPENKMYMEDGKTNSEEKGNNPQNNTEFGKVHKKDNKQADQGFVDQQSEAQAAANKGDVAGELGGLYDKTGAIPKGETLKEGKDFYKTRDKTFKSQVCKAVDETCKESDFPVPIHQVKKIHCLILETQRHKGFLVLTTSGFIDESFIEKLKQNLGHTLVIIHDLVVSLEVIDMKTEGLRFKEWAFEKAHFQYFSSHENHEIGVCYFDARDVFSQMVEPSGNELEPIPVENINHNSTVDMDLFIFLEKNKRYLKYIRRNGALSKKQKEKILASSISDFYIHSEDLRAYKRMLSRYYLEKLLEDDEESIKPNNSDKAA